jgi:hypothetical protein
MNLGPLKSLASKILPINILYLFRQFKRKREQRLNQFLTTEEVFTKIYELNKWGGIEGEFFSGEGTASNKVATAYISKVFEIAYCENFIDSTFVDLGCGDFSIGRRLLPLCRQYIGVDIVKPLIKRNQEKYEDTNIHFLHLNILEDELPEGNVCFIRQVFQHLSNREISIILPKLNKYRWVLITEHYPTDNNFIKPNLDKPHGADIRVYDNSGVYLTKPPFDLPEDTFKEILKVQGTGLWEGMDQGVIRTFLYKPNN